MHDCSIADTPFCNRLIARLIASFSVLLLCKSACNLKANTEASNLQIFYWQMFEGKFQYSSQLHKVCRAGVILCSYLGVVWGSHTHIHTRTHTRTHTPHYYMGVMLNGTSLLHRIISVQKSRGMMSDDSIHASVNISQLHDPI